MGFDDTFKKLWNKGKKLDPLTHKAIEGIVKLDSGNVKKLARGTAGLVGGEGTWLGRRSNDLGDEAAKNQADPVRGVGRAAASAGIVYGGMSIAGAGSGASAGAFGGTEAIGSLGVSGGTGLSSSVGSVGAQLGTGEALGVVGGSGMTSAGGLGGSAGLTVGETMGAAGGSGMTGTLGGGGTGGGSAAAGGAGAQDWSRLLQMDGMGQPQGATQRRAEPAKMVSMSDYGPADAQAWLEKYNSNGGAFGDGMNITVQGGTAYLRDQQGQVIGQAPYSAGLVDAIRSMENTNAV